MTIEPTHKQHSQTQKSIARRSGKNWLKRADELGEKAEIVCGGFFWDPTHHNWRVRLHVPEGQEAPVEIHQFLEMLSRYQPRASVRHTSSATDANEVFETTGEDEGETILSASSNATPTSPKAHMDATPGKNTILCSASSASKESFSSAHRAPTPQTEMGKPTGTVGTAMADTSTSLLVLREINDHVRQSITRMDEIKIPTVTYTEKIEELDAQIRDCFRRFRSPQSVDNEAIETDIIRHAGERKMLELHGLRDAENTYGKQLASVLQTLSDQLITTLGPAAVRLSLQNTSTLSREENIPDGLWSGASPSLGNMRARTDSGPLYDNHQVTESTPDLAHNGACHSLCDAGQRSGSKRLRDASSDTREDQRKRHAAQHYTTSGFENEYARTDRTSKVRVVESVSSQYSDAIPRAAQICGNSAM